MIIKLTQATKMYKIIKKKNKTFITKMLIAKAIVYTFLDIFLCIPNIHMYFKIKSRPAGTWPLPGQLSDRCALTGSSWPRRAEPPDGPAL